MKKEVMTSKKGSLEKSSSWPGTKSKKPDLRTLTSISGSSWGWGSLISPLSTSVLKHQSITVPPSFEPSPIKTLIQTLKSHIFVGEIILKHKEITQNAQF